MADDELDELYWVKPEQFTATRARLSGAAKERDDEPTAKRIAGARKPTTAAWVVNRLVLIHTKTKQRLADLHQRLVAAHAAMDGDRIRELTKEQRKLVEQLTESAFDVAEVKQPSASLRDDVVGTLQAAIADPDVNTRLGRLAKAESWSGFGDFGATTTIAVPKREKTKQDADQLAELKAALAEAAKAKAQADEQVSEREADVAAAERALKAARSARERARRVAGEAAAAVQEAQEQLTKRR